MCDPAVPGPLALSNESTPRTHMAKGDLLEKAEVTLQSHKAVSDWGNPLRLIS